MSAKAARIRLVQFEVLPGRPVENTARMLDDLHAARADGIDIVAFPEMAVPGYLLGDEWEHEAFLRECEACVDELCAATQGLIAVFGSVGIDWTRRNEDGRVRKYNALFVAEDGERIGPEGGLYSFVIKTLLPNYREFDDSRHFFDVRKLALEEGRTLQEMITPVHTSKLRLGCLLCEDAWDSDYGVSPLEHLAQAGAELFINISSSPFTAGKNHKRNRVFSAHARQLQRPLAYVNNVGIQNNGKTVFTYDGSSCIYDSYGGQLASPRVFAEDRLTVDVPLAARAAFGQPLPGRDTGIDNICDAILYGTREFLKLCGVRKVTVGVSGGIDSSVVAAIYAHLLPPTDLLLVNMPSRFNSTTTRDLARTLAENIGCLYVDVPIQESVELTQSQLDGLEIRTPDGSISESLQLSGFMLENVQARDRSSRVLAAVAAAFGGVFTCNANKSEATVGYSTLYGDLDGYLANLADLWKTEVYSLARHLNEDVFGREVIPQGSIDILPTAELSEAQSVAAGKGDPLIYPYHDKLFESWVEWWNRATPEENLAWYVEGTLAEKLGYDGDIQALFDSPRAFIDDLERWWGQYQGMGLAKRIQAPPVLAVKRRAFGFDHREAQMGVRYTRKYLAIKKDLLG